MDIVTETLIGFYSAVAACTVIGFGIGFLWGKGVGGEEGFNSGYIVGFDAGVDTARLDWDEEDKV